MIEYRTDAWSAHHSDLVALAAFARLDYLHPQSLIEFSALGAIATDGSTLVRFAPSFTPTNAPTFYADSGAARGVAGLKSGPRERAFVGPLGLRSGALSFPPVNRGLVERFPSAASAFLLREEARAEHPAVDASFDPMLFARVAVVERAARLDALRALEESVDYGRQTRGRQAELRAGVQAYARWTWPNEELDPLRISVSAGNLGTSWVVLVMPRKL